ncbi:MAG: type II toxin-antitoxin system RatA family toxin [Pseudomonadales bacterium]|nr:type II toxin-antitoxin system RatA family toxin [Pseudomonadales bacterium]
MTRLVRTALLAHPVGRMYALVNDVARYPDFVPGCRTVEVLERTDVLVVARVDAAARGFTASFTTSNTLVANERIDLELAEGPFERFTGAWLFQPLGEIGCKVTLQLDFRLKGLLRAAEPLLGRAADTVVNAFVQRASRG